MRLITTFLLAMVVLLTTLTAGCSKDKAMATIRDADNDAAKALIYIGQIAKANNDAFEARNIDKVVHQGVNLAAEKALNGTNAFIRAINAAKAAVLAGADPAGQVSLLKALFNAQVAGAVTGLLGQVTTLPPGLADKLAGWVAALQLVIDSITGLFAQADMMLREVNSNA